jgi:hypothetical protein
MRIDGSGSVWLYRCVLRIACDGVALELTGCLLSGTIPHSTATMGDYLAFPSTDISQGCAVFKGCYTVITGIPVAFRIQT